MKLRKLVAVLAAVFMVVSIIPLSVFAEIGQGFPWHDEESPTLVEQILERDGFIDGIWFPWFHGGTVGHNLTSNELMAEYYDVKGGTEAGWNYVELDSYGADNVYRDIYNLKSMGYNMLAYGGSIMAEGVVFDANGDVIGIKDEYLANARRLLEMCREIGMPVMWNVYFHCSSMPDYYGIDGWKVMCQMLGNNEVADHYAENFVRPLCEMLADYQDVVAIVSIADEPENEINDIGIGDHYEGIRALYGVNQDDMVYFMQQINEVVRDVLPHMPRTVASNSGNKSIYRDFDLDLMGHNQYTDTPNFLSIENMITDADVIMTEYNYGNWIEDDTAYAEKLIAFRQDLMAKGYKGGFQWCWMRGSSIKTMYALQRESDDATSFRKTVTLLKRYIDQYRAAYRGEIITLDAPVLYANMGDGNLLWIPSEKATAITIQRSDDGGQTWITLESNVDQDIYVDEYLVGRYFDNTARPASGYCYRIIATNGTSTVTSAPNNVAGTMDKFMDKDYVDPEITNGIFYQPTKGKTEEDAKLTSFGVEKNRPAAEEFNLIDNGSFESNDGQWNVSSFLQYASVVEDPTAIDGNKSLYFNTSSQPNAGWYTFTVDVKPNTDYTFSTFIKGAYLSNDNKGFGSIGVIDPDTGKFMVEWLNYKNYARGSRETQQIYPTAWDDEWHLRAVSFNSGDMTEVTIALYGYSSQMWVDGLALYESSNGAKYVNGESAKAITSNKWEDLSGIATNAVADPGVNNAAYWTSGAGYKQGFINAYNGQLTYTASSHAYGVRYTKWVAVKPNTDYYYSFTVSVSSVGGGRFAILDNAKALPNEVVVANFSSGGTVTYTGRISTGTYRQLGLCVVDLGGAATIDNITLYEAGESKPVVTTPSFDGYIVNGTFEIGSYEGWENLWGNNTVEIVSGYESEYAMQVEANEWTHVRQFVAVEPNTDYIIELYSKNASNAALLIKDGDDSYNINQTSLAGNGNQWTKTTLEFNSQANNQIIVSLMGNTNDAVYTVDNVTMRSKYGEPEGDEDEEENLLINGNFETGNSTPWENVWSQNTVQMVSGHNSNYAMKVDSNMYTVVRQKVTVKQNTTYVMELWVKDAVNASILIKDSADSYNIANDTLPYGSNWTKMKIEFNSGDNEAVFVGFMGNVYGSGYTVDDVVMYEKEVPTTTSGVLNGGFEERERYWMFNSGAHDIVTDAHSGNYALQLTNPDQWGEAAVQTIPVEPNSYYVITWWYKAPYDTDVFNLLAMFGTKNIVVYSGNNFMNHYTGSWQQGSYIVQTEDATSMLLKFTSEAWYAGTLLIDDITVEKMDCLHEYDYSCDDTCNLCGDVREVEHYYSWYSTEQSQTCTKDGIYHYKCYYCGHSYTEVIPATGNHNYYSYVSKSATCISDGIRVYECEYYYDCGQRYTEVIPATGNHSYDSDCDDRCNTCYSYRTAPHVYSGACDTVCDECYSSRFTSVAHTYSYDCDTYCNVCNYYREAYHNYVEMCRYEPSCGWDGGIEYECDICHNDGYWETLPATGNHRMDGVKITREPTCNQAGQQQVSCSVCNNYSYYESIPATGEHSYERDCDTQCTYCGQWTRTDATHTWGADGCIHCNERLFNGDFELGFDYWSCWDETKDQHAIVTDAHSGNFALQLSGVKQYDESAAQIINVLPYTQYTISWWYKAAPGSGTYHLFIMNTDGWGNLTHDGYMNSYTGEWQQKSVVINTGDATSIMLKFSTDRVLNNDVILIDDVSVKSQQDLCNHDWEWIGETAPTCTENGINQYYCCLCDSERVEVIPSPGHNYRMVDMCPPSCTEEGYRVYECVNDWEYYCGHIYTEMIPPTCAVSATYYEGYEPGCHYEGLREHLYCAHCDIYYLDWDCTIIATYADLIIPALNTPVVHVEAKAPTCFENGNVEYWICYECEQVWTDAALTQLSNIKNIQIAMGHTAITHVVAKASTCNENGNIEHWYCADCGMAWLDTACTLNTNLMAVQLPTTDHTYDNDYDADCDVCGSIRETDLPIVFGGYSVSEQVSGLAFRFDVNVSGMALDVTTAVYDNATIDGYRLLAMGATATNDIDTIDISAEHLCYLTAESCSFAVRIIEIPTDKYDAPITVTPYLVLEMDGVTTYLYGPSQTASFNGVLNR